MTIRAIAWDVDGTLVDSEPLHQRALLAAGRRWDVDLSSIPDDAFRGIHMHDVWAAVAGRFPPGLARRDWLAAIDEHYRAEAASLRPLPGAVEAFRSFAARGLPQACVSNSNRRIVDANLEALGIARSVAFSLSFDDVEKGKPDPEPYSLACRRLGLAPDTVLAVEDSATGLTSARAAGLRTAGYGPEVAGFGEADILFNAFAALVAWVDAQRDTTSVQEDR